jgi:hypothetical protein
LGAGAKAKTVTNNLPLLSVLAQEIVNYGFSIFIDQVGNS